MTKIGTLKRLVLTLLSLALLAGISLLVFQGNIAGDFDISYKYNLGKAVTAVAVFLLLLAFAPLPTEVPGPIKIRTGLVVLLGSAILGFWVWPCLSPETKFDPVIFYNMNFANLWILMIFPVCILLSFVCYFLTYPYGKETAMAAIPLGLSIVSIRSGSITNLLSQAAEPAIKAKILTLMRWEGGFWLLLILAGYAGIWLAEKACNKQTQKDSDVVATKSKSVNVLLVLAVNLAVAYFGLLVFCQNSHVFDSAMKSAILQPSNGQIAFGLLLSFGLAGFLCKYFFNANYIYTIISTAIFSFIAAIIASKAIASGHIYLKYPIVFMATPLVGIIPLQFVALGSLGGICGYWYAVLYKKWQKENAGVM